MVNIPDDPIISRMMRTGYPWIDADYEETEGKEDED